jgi:hypothetical protein
MCPKKYDFTYNQRLSTPSYSSNLWFGSFVHARRAIYHAEMISPEALAQAEKEFQEIVEVAQRDHREALDQIESDLLLAMSVTKLWYDYWSKPTTLLGETHLQWLDVEAEWKFEVPFGDKKAIHAGKRDGYVRHKKWGTNFLYELKTATDSNRDSYLYRLNLDHQISSNAIALKKAGLSCSGILYDIIWKPALRRKVDRKTMPDESLKEFRERLLEEYAENPEKYFARVTINRTEEQLNSWMADLSEQFRILDDTKQFYRNPGACTIFGGCSFMGLCMADSNESYGFIKRSRKHPELTQAG